MSITLLLRWSPSFHLHTVLTLHVSSHSHHLNLLLNYLFSSLSFLLIMWISHIHLFSNHIPFRTYIYSIVTNKHKHVQDIWRGWRGWWGVEGGVGGWRGVEGGGGGGGGWRGWRGGIFYSCLGEWANDNLSKNGQSLPIVGRQQHATWAILTRPDARTATKKMTVSIFNYHKLTCKQFKLTFQM